MLHQTKLKLIALGIANFILIGAFSLLYLSTIGKVSDATINEEKIRNEIIRKESIDIMKKNLGNDTDYEKELKKYLIGNEESDLATFISTLEKFSADHALKFAVSSVSFEDAPKLTAISSEYAKLRITFSGKWENTQSMIAFLENYPFKIEIKSVSMQKNYENKDWSLAVDFNVAKIKN